MQPSPSPSHLTVMSGTSCVMLLPGLYTRLPCSRPAEIGDRGGRKEGRGVPFSKTCSNFNCEQWQFTMEPYVIGSKRTCTFTLGLAADPVVVPVQLHVAVVQGGLRQAGPLREVLLVGLVLVLVLASGQ